MKKREMAYCKHGVEGVMQALNKLHEGLRLIIEKRGKLRVGFDI